MVSVVEVVDEDARDAGWDPSTGEPKLRRVLASSLKPQDASKVMAKLHAVLPAVDSGISHLKRVSKGPSGLRILLASREDYDRVAADLTDLALTPEDVDVPENAPTTSRHFDLGSRVWPMSGPCRGVESRGASPTRGDVQRLVDDHAARLESDRSGVQTRRRGREAIFRAAKCALGGALLIDPETNAVVAAAAPELDARQGSDHALLHAPMLAIDALARRHRALRSDGTTSAAARMGAYLCTGLDLLTTDEPCVMCAMALVHSRIRRVAFSDADAKRGGLGSTEKVHTLRTINHRYRVWRFQPS
ncbi:cytidine deaminase-like protein [Pelagophyceae sp. CCMP2097]|nr:cytidine deaminase-like protein [Pelagophyceae sp. CCMP2097]